MRELKANMVLGEARTQLLHSAHSFIEAKNLNTVLAKTGY